MNPHITPLLLEHYGLEFSVLASYPEADTVAVNACMEARSGAALQCIRGGVACLADQHDKTSASTWCRSGTGLASLPTNAARLLPSNREGPRERRDMHTCPEVGKTN
jgi:hypothetical protein